MSSTHIQTVIIHTQPVELCKLLKIANLVSGGGEAKIVISQGLVKLNGEHEFQKRKKIVDGDIIELNGEIIKAVFKEQFKHNVVNTNVVNKKSNTKEIIIKKQRKPINF